MIKVAAYCRVSTDKEDQTNSFLTQQRFFKEYVAGNPDWELHRIYADEGITGTSTKKRAQFNQMISDAKEGRFSMILTKEVSRFSRNILDTITYTRQLKDIGVGVLFLNDRIHTLDPEAEIFLSFLASMAQEESRRTSSRVIWGQTRQMEKGIVFGTSLLGYQVRNGTISIEEQGAEIVRLIFHKYAVEQMGTSEIARFLQQEGHRTSRGNCNWSPNSIIKILKNEKYVGDLIQKKTYTPNFLTHEKVRNQGQVPMIRIENHHDPIVTRDIWEQAQLRLERNNKRRERREPCTNKYPFSGKICCGCCGAGFVGRFRYLSDRKKVRIWRCSTATRFGASACPVALVLKDEEAREMITAVVRSCIPNIQKFSRLISEMICHRLSLENDRKQKSDTIQNEITRIQHKKSVMLDNYLEGNLSLSDMEIMRTKYDQRISDLEIKLNQLTGTENGIEERKQRIEASVLSMLEGTSDCQVFYKSFVELITVYPDQNIEMKLSGIKSLFVFRG